MKLRLFISGLLFFAGISAFAQDIKLSDVSKIACEVGVPNNNIYWHIVVELVSENNQWKSYQTLYYRPYDPKTKLPVSDSIRKFLKIIPADTLNLLLDILSKNDTTANERNFKIDVNQLIKYTDTVDKELNPQQKQRFIKAIQNPSIVHDALMSAVFPKVVLNEGGSWQSIIIKTKNGKDVVVGVIGTSLTSDLPWGDDKQRIYDPRITDIFYDVMNDVKGAQTSRNSMYWWIDQEIYFKYFVTEFFWEDFKVKHPEVYASFKGTLMPARLVKGNKVSGVAYVSSRLPANVLIDFWLYDNLDSAIYKYKSYEDTLVQTFAKQNFLFSYFKRNNDANIYVYPGRMRGYRGLKYFEQIQKYYPEVIKLDHYKPLLVHCMTKNKTYSHWMILPNNQILLLSYTGILVLDDKQRFKDISPAQDPKKAEATHPVCIVFNSKGQRIGGSDNAKIEEY